MYWHPDPTDRRFHDSLKWKKYPDSELPLWVADMDCAPPPCVNDVIQREIHHGIFGYGLEPKEFREAWIHHLAKNHNWTIDPDWIVPVAGVVPGMRFALMLPKERNRVFAPTPCYQYFKAIPDSANKMYHGIQLHKEKGILTTSLDAIENQFRKNTGPAVMLWCNPQNPGGTVYDENFVAGLSALCHEHDVLLVSDEIWSDLIRTEMPHSPLGKYAQPNHLTITLMAATKTFNIAAFPCAIAIIPNTTLRKTYQQTITAMPQITPLSYRVTEACLRHGWSWRRSLLAALKNNLCQIQEWHSSQNQLSLITGDASFLAWFTDISGRTDLDLRLAAKGLRVSSGSLFGDSTSVRLNFGCSPDTLAEALKLMKKTINNE